ncbi:MAG: hypothetical protein IPK66_13975 [Rhodospirillales bacterium]|nr:hypothetical protein [Rhodospirillales bacterium]
MAQQFHVANSARIMGAGIFAAGPYACAAGGFPLTMLRSLDVCSDVLSPLPFFGPPDPKRAITAADDAAQAGLIDPTATLHADRVLLFSGRLDTLVPTSVMQSLATFYEHFVDAQSIRFITDIKAQHAMVTAGYGNACDALADPFISNCGFDLAGTTLQHIYGPLAAPVRADGRMITFFQGEFTDPTRPAGLADDGFAYVPKRCADGGCRLHVVFHGCRQNAETIGDVFYRHAGYNEWAEANDIVVLYPQAAALTRTFAGATIPWPNPQGCWDWWGFTGDDYARRSGPQIAAVSAMIDLLAGDAPVSGSSEPESSCARADDE